MATANKIRESGTAGQPGETTARTSGANATAKGKERITPESTQSLLISELAKLELPDAEDENNASEAASPEQGRAKSEAAENREEAETTGATAGNEEAAEETPGQETETESESESESQSGNESETEGDEAAEGEDAEQAEGEAAPDLEGALADPVKDWIENGRGKLPPALQSLFDKRIGKLTGEREEHKAAREQAEARVQALEGEIEKFRKDPDLANLAATGVQIVPSRQDIERMEATGQTFLDRAEAYLDDSATPQEKAWVERYLETTGMDASALRRQVRQVQRELTVQLPKQRQQVEAFTAKERETEAEVARFVPFLNDRKDPRYAMAQEVLREWPDLPKRTAVHRMVIGTFVLGMERLKELDAAAKTGKTGTNGSNGKAAVRTAVKAPPRIPNGGSAVSAPRVTGGDMAETAVRQKLRDKPTSENAQNLIKAGLRF